MSVQSASVEQWKNENQSRMVPCRWGCSMTLDSCRSYQLRTDRYVVHFQGTASPRRTVNADYVRCFLPEPCPYALSDEEASQADEETAPDKTVSLLKFRAVRDRALMRDRLVNPDHMVREPDWRRSLLLAGRGDECPAEGLY